jgi:dUTP pyrophosphatase
MMTSSTLYIKRIDPDGPFLVPSKSYQGDAGYDLGCAATVTIHPGKIVRVPTNLAVAIPSTHWGLLVGRSSTFLRLGLYVNIGIIDSGFRNEIVACVENRTDKPVTIKPFDPLGTQNRYFQLILIPKPNFDVKLVDDLPPGDRGPAGLGSTTNWNQRG